MLELWGQKKGQSTTYEEWARALFYVLRPNVGVRSRTNGAMLVEWTNSKDRKTMAKMAKNAELVKTHGFEAVMCLMGRGIAEETATRIFRGHRKGDMVGLLRLIHEAELKYARTRRYWS